MLDSTRIVTKRFWAGTDVEVGEIIYIKDISRFNASTGIIFEKFHATRHNLGNHPECKVGHGWYMPNEEILKKTELFIQGLPDWEV